MVNMNKNNPHKRSFPGSSLISRGEGALRLKLFENPWSRSYPVLGGLSQSPRPPCTGLTPLQIPSPFSPRRSQVAGWRRRRRILPHPSHQRPLPLCLPTAPPVSQSADTPCPPGSPGHPARRAPTRQAGGGVDPLEQLPGAELAAGAAVRGLDGLAHAHLAGRRPLHGASKSAKPRGQGPRSSLRAPAGRPLPAGRPAAGAPGGDVRRQEYREEGDRRFCPRSSQIRGWQSWERPGFLTCNAGTAVLSPEDAEIIK